MSRAPAAIEALIISRAMTMRDTLAAMDRTARGLLLVCDEDGRFERTVTDGDLRRALLGGAGMNDGLDLLPEHRSTTARDGISRRAALAMMNEARVDHLPLLDSDGRLTDLLERKAIDSAILLSTPHMGEHELEYVEQAFRDNWIAPLGPNVDAFEADIAGIAKVTHATALSSGTAAIHLALKVLDVAPGDLVMCSSFTFAASANPIRYVGAEPVFIDSERASWNMSPAALERALSEARRDGRRVGAVIVVNLYGQSADYDPIRAVCEGYGVPIVEDAAESLGATYKGKPSGGFGRLGIFSFNGNKIITTSGGGMLVSDEGDLIERAQFLATQAREPVLHYEHREIGFNYRMSNILAGVGRGQVRVLGERVARRRAIFDTYLAELGDCGFRWMPEPDWSFSTHWLSTATLDEARFGMTTSDLIAQLSDELIETRPLWKPMHLQPVFKGARYVTDGSASVSDELFATGICLPSGSNMSDAELARAIDTIRGLARGSRAA
ncbi:MAG: aminotransferase class I/II-fold pyridoxal phosphate-dependent enzyme [Erythrobacter sp.]